nr:rhodanese-like domain-containing protein [Pseudemcibacter aquimaris]
MDEFGDDVHLLDVRTPKEWNDGHIKGAINVPVGEFSTKVSSLNLNGDKPIVAICLSAHRSIPAVRVLLKNGFKNAVQLEGGMKAWRAANGPEVKR